MERSLTSPMILCITPSPAIDRTGRVDRFATDQVLRPSDLTVLPGGKGVNVARVARALGALVATTGYAGGHAGRWLVEALGREGLNPQFVETSAETRTTYVLIERSGRALLVYEAAPPVSDGDVGRLADLLRDELLPAAEFVVISGSLPSGSDPSRAGELVALCHRARRPCLVDLSGSHLAAALEARPDVVKISLMEAAEAGLGRRDRQPSARDAATELCRLGAARAVVTDGPRGASAHEADGAEGAGAEWTVTVPRIRVVDAVGSGDAFSAGLAVGLAGGRTFADALAMGAAAGAANTQSIGAGRFDLGQYQRILGEVEVTQAAISGRRRRGSA